MEFSKQLDVHHEIFIDGVFAAVEYEGRTTECCNIRVRKILAARGWSTDAITFWINNYHKRKNKAPPAGGGV